MSSVCLSSQNWICWNLTIFRCQNRVPSTVFTRPQSYWGGVLQNQALASSISGLLQSCQGSRHLLRHVGSSRHHHSDGCSWLFFPCGLLLVFLFLKRTSFIYMPAALQWIDAIIQYDVMELPTKFDCWRNSYTKVASLEWLKICRAMGHGVR